MSEHWNRLKLGAAATIIIAIFVFLMQFLFVFVAISLPKDSSYIMWLFLIVGFIVAIVYGIGMLLLWLTRGGNILKVGR